jgi:hypothetical protein
MTENMLTTSLNSACKRNEITPNTKRLCAFIALTLSQTLFISSTFAANIKPKLVLQITVDQLRADLPQRYMKNMGEGGFKYLYQSGVNYLDANHPHANTETIVGHATLATGATPAMHGMIGNAWFDREKNRAIYNIEDARYPLLSLDADVNQKTELDPTQRKARSSGRSPSNMLVSTFSDELMSLSQNQAKVFGVSVKDRGAVSMAGHAGKAFWFSKKTASFVSSEYYYDKYPQWVVDWNAEKYAADYFETSWSLMLPQEQYLFGDKDLQKGEINFPGFGNTFPHAFGDKTNKYFSTFLTLSPVADELTASFAKTLIEEEALGQDDITDYLSISFSATDYVGHLFGPSSLEMEDNLLRLDKTLASLFNYIDQKIGLDDVLIVLSADHGGADSVEYMTEQGAQAEHVDPNTWQLEAALSPIKKKHQLNDKLITAYMHPYVYLNNEVITASNINRAEIIAILTSYIEAQANVSFALSSDEISSGNLPNTRVYQSVINNHNNLRSGDIFVVFKPNSFINDMEGLHVAAHHGSAWRYDSHVPLIFAGSNLTAKTVTRAVSTMDVARTLSALVGAKSPSGAEGKVLKEIVK